MHGIPLLRFKRACCEGPVLLKLAQHRQAHKNERHQNKSNYTVVETIPYRKSEKESFLKKNYDRQQSQQHVEDFNDGMYKK